MKKNKPDYTIEQIIDAVTHYGDMTPKEAETALIELMEYVIGDDDYCCSTPVGRPCPHGDTAARNEVRQEQRQRLEGMKKRPLLEFVPGYPDPVNIPLTSSTQRRQPQDTRPTDDVYRCRVPFQDGYANYSVGDIFELARVDHRSDRLAVYPKHGHPVSFEAFQFCFEESHA